MNINYTCVCGRTFTNPQAFNGHKSHCKANFVNKYGENSDFEQIAAQRKEKVIAGVYKRAEQQREQKEIQWVSEAHVCEHCGKPMLTKFGSGRFCSRACANSRTRTSDSKAKVSEAMRTSEKISQKKLAVRSAYALNPKKCSVCGSILSWEQRKLSTCGNQSCIAERIRTGGLTGGLKSVQAQASVRRSKNEIFFASLCKDAFKEVSCNEPIFDGWDADVIIHDYKIAVLWNGIWHYKKVREKHSVEQVQCRDQIKLQLIRNSGYVPYVIKDLGKADEQFVRREFDKLIEYIKEYLSSI